MADELHLSHLDLLDKAEREAPEVVAGSVDRWRELEERGPTWLVLAMLLFGVAAFGFALVGDSLGEGSAVPPGSLVLLTLGVPLLFAGLSALSDLLAGPLERARMGAARRHLALQLRADADGWLTQQINEARKFSFETVLSYRGAARLAEIDDSGYEVPTTARRRLEDMLTRMPGGAIALAGPRGVGKTVLLRSICEERRSAEGKRVHRVVVDAPVEYEPRDFVLHLFAQVCSQVVGSERVARLRGWNRPFARGRGIVGRIRERPALVLGLAAMAAGLVLWRGLQISSLGMDRSDAGLALLAVGAAISVAALAAERSRLLEGVQEWLASRGSQEDEEHVRTALVRLRQIWFQQTYSSGWSGGFKAPLLSLEGKVSYGLDLADRQMTYPDVVRLFRDFLELISSESLEVRIGIDELDKMEAEVARRFLNNIKVIFRVPNCFFFVSVSEEAMSTFKRRGAGFRDAFDSSFDEVLAIPHLKMIRSLEMIHGRVVALPIPFIFLLHAVSGGLPRDLIRAARDLFEMPVGTGLEEATALLVRRSLRGRIHATEVAARDLRSENGRSLLSFWLGRAAQSLGTPSALLGLCERFEAEFLGPLSAAAADVDSEEREELRRLGTEVVGGAYLAATLMQFCERLDVEEFAVGLLETAQEGEPNLVEALASAFQTFAADIVGAWRETSELREEMGLPVLDFPRGDDGDAMRELAA